MRYLNYSLKLCTIFALSFSLVLNAFAMQLSNLTEFSNSSIDSNTKMSVHCQQMDMTDTNTNSDTSDHKSHLVCNQKVCCAFVLPPLSQKNVTLLLNQHSITTPYFSTIKNTNKGFFSLPDPPPRSFL